MSNVLQIDIDDTIVLPDTCDNMPEELRGHLIAALSNACKVYDCAYKDLRWSVKVDPTSKQPYFRIKKRD